MTLSRENRALRVGGTTSGDNEQRLMQGDEVESAIEAAGECRQLSCGMPSAGEDMVAAGQAGRERSDARNRVLGATTCPAAAALTSQVG